MYSPYSYQQPIIKVTLSQYRTTIFVTTNTAAMTDTLQTPQVTNATFVYPIAVKVTLSDKYKDFIHKFKIFESDNLISTAFQGEVSILLEFLEHGK